MDTIVKPVPMVRVRRIGRGFCVAGREVAKDEIAQVPLDVATALAAFGKAEILEQAE